MKRSHVGAVVAIVIALGTAYLGSPYWAVMRVRGAVAARDVDRLNDFIDYPAVRDSLKAQLVAKFQKESDNPDMRDNPFAGLGAVFAMGVVNNVVDALVTPDGMASLIAGADAKAALRNGKPVDGDATNVVSATNAAGTTPGAPPPELESDFTYSDLDTFQIRLFHEGNDESVTFVMRRDGLVGWRIKRVVMPL